MQVHQDFTHEARKLFMLRRTKWRKDARCDYGATWLNGWQKLGSGYYGEAWEHQDHPGFVVKISGVSGWGYDTPGMCKDDAKDDIWQDFAEVCMQHPHPNLPRIMHFERMGRLAWAIMPTYERYCEGTYEPVVENFKAVMRQQRVAEAWMLPMVELARQPYVAVDLHDENVMLDPESGEVIITDPFSTTGFREYTIPEHEWHAGVGGTDRTHYSDDGTSDEFTDEFEDELTEDSSTEEGELQC